MKEMIIPNNTASLVEYLFSVRYFFGTNYFSTLNIYLELTNYSNKSSLACPYTIPDFINNVLSHLLGISNIQVASKGQQFLAILIGDYNRQYLNKLLS